MDYAVSVKATAELTFRLPADDAVTTPEKAAARALGGDEVTAREALRARIAAAVRGAIQAVLVDTPVQPHLQVNVALDCVCWGESELEYDDCADMVGDCADCGKVILDRSIEGEPWTYGGVDEHYHQILCYSCAELRKAKGSVVS